MIPLVPSEIVEEEQMEANENIEKTIKRDFDWIEMDLERTILMVEKQENIVLIAQLQEQENANENGEPRAHIDGGDITIELHLL